MTSKPQAPTVSGADRAPASWPGGGDRHHDAATGASKGPRGRRVSSSATKGEGRQNMLCAYLSVALLLGLGANALFGLWWADPVSALVIAGVAIKEGRESWRGESCCTAPIGVPGEAHE